MRIGSEIVIEQELAEALKKAVVEFGEGVLIERRLIGILKDFQAFGHCQPAELIIRTMIESNSMRRFRELRTLNGKDLEAFLLREISTHEGQFGFSEKWLEIVFRSVLTGLGCCNLPTVSMNPTTKKAGNPDSRSPQPEKQTGPTAGTVLDPLDIRNIPRDKNYLLVQKELCDATKGLSLTYYKSGGRKYALFSCGYGPFRNVEVKVCSDNSINTTDEIQITLLYALSKDHDRLRNDVGKALTFLDSKYDINTSQKNLYSSSFSNHFLENEFRSAQNKEQSQILRAYDMAEGTVTCRLVLRHNGYSILLTLSLRTGGWNPKQNGPTTTPSSPAKKRQPATTNFKAYLNRVKRVISRTFDIDRDDIEADTMLYEIEDMGGDIEELINELENEFGVYLDIDLVVDEYMTVSELTREIKDID